MTAAERAAPDAEAIENWIRAHIADLTGMTAQQVSRDLDFDEFGIDSVQGVAMVTALEVWLGTRREIPFEIIFDAGSIAQAAERIDSYLDTQATSS